MAALDVVDDAGPRVARQDVLGEQHHQHVGPDDSPAAGDEADAVAVAVEGEAAVGALRPHGGEQVDQVGRVGRVGVVIGEVSVDVAVELDHLAAQFAQKLRCNAAGHAVAAVDHHLQGVDHLDIAKYAVDVAAGNVRLAAEAAFALAQGALVDARLQLGDGVPRQAPCRRASSSGRCTPKGCGCR